MTFFETTHRTKSKTKTLECVYRDVSHQKKKHARDLPLSSRFSLGLVRKTVAPSAQNQPILNSKHYTSLLDAILHNNSQARETTLYGLQLSLFTLLGCVLVFLHLRFPGRARCRSGCRPTARARPTRPTGRTP